MVEAPLLSGVPMEPSAAAAAAAATAGVSAQLFDGAMQVLQKGMDRLGMLRYAVHIGARIAYVASFLIAVLAALLWYFQEKLLFYPGSPKGFERPDKNPYPFQNPGQMGIPYEDVTIVTPDGCTLHAWFMKQKAQPPHSVPTLMFFQGNAGNMGLRMTNLRGLFNHGRFNVFALSYRGYGYSTGEPSEEGLYTDAQAGLDYLLGREDVDKSSIFVFGRSIGGAVAIDLALKRQNELRGVIVENTFTSLREMLLIVFPVFNLFSPVCSLVQRLYMDSISKVPRLRIPMMYISGLQDALVPPSQMARLYQSSTASSFAHMYTVANGTHNDTWQQGDHYYVEINRFVKKAL